MRMSREEAERKVNAGVIAEWDAAIINAKAQHRARTGRDMSHDEAVRHVSNNNPTLHKSYLMVFNPGKKIELS